MIKVEKEKFWWESDSVLVMLASCLVGSRLTACHYSSICRTTEASIYQQGRQPIIYHHVLSMAEVETAEPKALTRFWYQEYMHLSQPTRHIKATREEKKADPHE